MLAVLLFRPVSRSWSRRGAIERPSPSFTRRGWAHTGWQWRRPIAAFCEDAIESNALFRCQYLTNFLIDLIGNRPYLWEGLAKKPVNLWSIPLENGVGFVSLRLGQVEAFPRHGTHRMHRQPGRTPLDEGVHQGAARDRTGGERGKQ